MRIQAPKRTSEGGLDVSRNPLVFLVGNKTDLVQGSVIFSVEGLGIFSEFREWNLKIEEIEYYFL